MPEITNELSTLISLYVVLSIPVILTILFFVKYPKHAINKKRQNKVKNAKVNDKVITRFDGKGEIVSIDSHGLIEVKLETGKFIQYAWWGIDDIIEE